VAGTAMGVLSLILVVILLPGLLPEERAVPASPQRQARASHRARPCLVLRARHPGAVRALPTAIRTAPSGHPGDRDRPSDLHPARIQRTTKAHPGSVTARDHDGPLMTVCDNDDRAGGTEEGRNGARSMQGHRCHHPSRDAPKIATTGTACPARAVSPTGVFGPPLIGVYALRKMHQGDARED